MSRVAAVAGRRHSRAKARCVAGDGIHLRLNQSASQLVRQIHEHIQAPLEQQAIDLFVGITAVKQGVAGAEAGEHPASRMEARHRAAAGAVGEAKVQRAAALHPVIDHQLVARMSHDEGGPARALRGIRRSAGTAHGRQTSTPAAFWTRFSRAGQPRRRPSRLGAFAIDPG